VASVKILDRYIIASVTGSFLFGVAMFMALLLALEALPDLIQMITQYNVPVGKALLIFALALPRMMAFAFPMSVLLGILLAFNRMSAESEMVAMRAGGVSFMRIVLPTLAFALVITGITYLISDRFGPWAGEKAFELRREALKQSSSDKPLAFLHEHQGALDYAIISTNLDAKKAEMRGVSIIWYKTGKPAIFLSVPLARWHEAEKRWTFEGGATGHLVYEHAPNVSLTPNTPDADIDADNYALRLKASPFEIEAQQKKPEDMTSTQIQHYVELLVNGNANARQVNKAIMEQKRRLSISFASLVMALIAAPLGLRSHRTSNAVGMGISLLLIFAYYFLAQFLKLFGESGQISTTMAAWLPNILAGTVGMGLLWRANR